MGVNGEAGKIMLRSLKPVVRYSCIEEGGYQRILSYEEAAKLLEGLCF